MYSLSTKTSGFWFTKRRTVLPAENTRVLTESDQTYCHPLCGICPLRSNILSLWRILVMKRAVNNDLTNSPREMQAIYTTWQNGMNEDRKRSRYRLLKRLRIALLIWLLSFIITVIWFSYAQ